MPTVLWSFPIVVVLAASIAAAITDLKMFRIPNALTFPLLASGLVYQVCLWGPPGLGRGLLGVAFGFAILLPFWIAGGMGAGDVKLMAAVGAWLGLRLTFQVFVASALAAGVYAMVMVLVTGRWRELWDGIQLLWIRITSFDFAPRNGAAELQAIAASADRRARLIPFGVLVAAGLLVTLARL